jgi:hypothetical protein
MAIAALLGRAGARLIAGEYQDSGQLVKCGPASRPAMTGDSRAWGCARMVNADRHRVPPITKDQQHAYMHAVAVLTRVVAATTAPAAISLASVGVRTTPPAARSHDRRIDEEKGRTIDN